MDKTGAVKPFTRRGTLRSPARLRLAAAGLAVAGLCADSTPAHAEGFLDAPGQTVGIGIQAAMVACSVVSIGGNAANIAMKNPQRGWMYSGYICGFMNTLMSPIIMIFFREPVAEYAYGSGAVHGVVGITNLGLAIYNGVLWHRARTTDKPPPKLAVMPLLVHEPLGAQVYGLSVGIASF